MTLPNYIVAEYQIDGEENLVLNYHSLTDGDDHTDLSVEESLVSSTGAEDYGVAHFENLGDDGALRIFHLDWTDVNAGLQAVKETVSSMPVYNASPNGFVFIGELPEKVITTGDSTQASDFKDTGETPIVELPIRGGATAYHDKGQVFVSVIIKAQPSYDVANIVAEAVIQAACDALTNLDINGVLGKISNLPEVPGVWTHTETDNPFKVGVAGGQAHLSSEMDKPAVVNVMAMVNISIDLEAQNISIVPCGLADKPLVDLKTAGFSTTTEAFKVAWGKKLFEALSPLHVTEVLE